MLVLGLTGGMATGKSTTSRILSEPPYTLPIVDADIIAREVVKPNTRAYRKIVAHFGEDVVLGNNQGLDRPALGRKVFGNEKERKVLNRIVHPAVRLEMVRQIVWHWLVGGASILVLDVPLLFESGLDIFCQKSIVVACGQATQIKRLILRDGDKGMTEEDARNRISSQGDLEDKCRRADIVIRNDTSEANLKQNVHSFIAQVKPNPIWTLLLRYFPPLGLIIAAWTVIRRWTRRKYQQRSPKTYNKCTIVSYYIRLPESSKSCADAMVSYKCETNFGVLNVPWSAELEST